MMVPWFKLHARDIESFRREGERTVIGLEGNATIDLDWAKKTYVVTLDEAEIARDGTTFCPLDEQRVAFYTVATKELSAPLPKGLEPRRCNRPRPDHKWPAGSAGCDQKWSCDCFRSGTAARDTVS